MNELRSLTLALTRQKSRLNELIEISGKFDPEHPLQAFSIRRIEWLKKRIEEEEKKIN